MEVNIFFCISINVILIISMCYIFISYFVENEQYQPSSSGAVDLSHATIHLLQQQILLVQQIVRGQQIINKLLTKLIMSNGESKPQA